uniref:RNA polymerase subunit beta n=1 Tax=Prototheca fontanea TaxID=2836215 RepID=UPI0030020805
MDKTLNSLLHYYLKIKNKKNRLTILSLIPNLLNIQKLSFKQFIEYGLSLGIENINPLRFYDKFNSLEVFFFSKHIQYIQAKKSTLSTLNSNEETYGYDVFLPILIKIKNEPKAYYEWIHFGFLPFMEKSGHFIINGNSRVVLNQLIRIPGIYKLLYKSENDQELRLIPYIQIIPDSGNWITIHFDKNQRLWITTKILKKKLSFIIFLQALGINIVNIFKYIPFSEILLSSIVPPVKSLDSENLSRHDNILLNAGLYHHPYTQLEACKYIYAHYLEYSSSQNEKSSFSHITDKEAYLFFHQMIWNSENRYLGFICRSQFSKKLNISPFLNNLELIPEDFIYITQTLINLLSNRKTIDDIDDLTNKTIQGCGDFLYKELITGINEASLILNRKIQKLQENEENIELDLYTFWEINKSTLVLSITKAWKDFFVSGTLSQYLDETNPLAEITHKRRITFLGPGGITNQQATIKIRGIHPTYYGRLCPIETPEGQNAGLVHSITIFAHKTIDGFLTSPYFKIFKGQIQKNLGYCFLNRYDEKFQTLLPPDVKNPKWGLLPDINFPVRQDLFFDFSSSKEITAQSVSSLQMISLATSVIPFLEHDDANRALMGSNMQRQAVSLINPDIAQVKTIIELRIASDINKLIQAEKNGFIYKIHATSIQLYKPKKIQKIQNYSEFLFEQLKNLNFKINVYLVLNFVNCPYNLNTLTVNYKKKIKINNFYLNVNKKKFSSFFNFSKFEYLKNNYNSVKNNNNFFKISFDYFKQNNQSTCGFQKSAVYELNWVKNSSILVDNGSTIKGNLAIGKNVFVAYLPWEGYNFEDAILISNTLVSKNIFTSLHFDSCIIEVEQTVAGLETITKDIPLFSQIESSQISNLDSRGLIKKGTWVKEGDYLVGKVSPMLPTGIDAQYQKLYKSIIEDKKALKNLKTNTSFKVPKGLEGLVVDVEIIPPTRESLILLVPKDTILCVKLTILQRRKIQIGDKIAGRHGNKGVISKILPVENMPYLADGTPIDVILNPLGIPSRMNVGQVLDCLLGLAGKYLNESYTVNLFDEKFGKHASRSFVFSKLYEASIKTKKSWLFEPTHPGKVKMFDGRTGIAFQQPITVGYTYMLKLIHMVDDKIHARSTGPYSSLTQQPVRGKARNGGQRVGEMEVWAFQAYGAAYTLQELLTIKSDDIDGRKKATLNIVLQDSVEIKQPESIKLILREIQSLCFNIEIYAPSAINKIKKLTLIDLNDLDLNLI